MITANLTIVRIYQFLGEAFLFYLLLVPFYYFRDIPLPMGSYIIAVVGTTVILVLFTRVTDTYIPFLIYAPVAVMLFVVMGYSLLIAIAMAAFFSWRFIRHLQEEGMDHEYRLITLGLFLALIESLLITDFAMYLMVGLQVSVLIFGYMLSHVVSIKISNSNQKPFTQIGVIGAAFVLITGISYSAYNGLERMWNGTLTLLANIFSYGMLGVVNFLDFLGVDLAAIGQLEERIKESQQSDVKMEMPESPITGKTKNSAGAENAGETIYWSFLSIIIVIAIIVAIILIRKKVLEKRKDPDSDEASMTSKWTTQEKSSLRDKISKFFGRKPENPVRQLFFDFERFAQKKGFGRKNYETIEDWFERLGMKDANVEVYQKVRYGDETSLTDEEVERFKQDLQQLRQSLIAKVKNKEE